MKQLLQNLRTGESEVLEVPAPRPGPNDIVVRNRASVISSGTERMILEFSQHGLLTKARARPDLVRQVFDKLRRDGLLNAIGAVRTRLAEPLALGYSSAGEVIAVGPGVTGFRIGDCVACGGGGFAVHAEAVRIPRTLAAHIPPVVPVSGREAISFKEAAFAAIGSVALHGLRLASPHLGETIAVIGLGVVGLIAVQLVRATGCRCIAMDPNLARCELAQALGCDRVGTRAEEFEILAAEHTRGTGVDSVLVAAATESSEPLELAARIARDRARVISIGATGTDLPRKLFYEKELQFKVSRAYGPGRYDTQYEELGQDYPVGYVRWTEGRNLSAFLELLAQGKVDVRPLISHRFPIASAEQAYELIASRRESLAVVIEYPGEHELAFSVSVAGAPPHMSRPEAAVRVGLLGAGNFVKSTLLPAMKSVAETEMVAVCAASGTSAAKAACTGGFSVATTDPNRIFADSQINTVIIATRHHLHAAQIVAALDADKHVFCEKPLCLNDDELLETTAAYRSANERSGRILMVGFNRRFAPLVLKLKEFLKDVREPLVMNYRVNAGMIPASHWMQDPLQGGGRIVGECCHFIDLMAFLCSSQPEQVFCTATPDMGRYHSDNLILQLTFANGSTGTIAYVASGDRAAGKERLEVFGQGKTSVLDDFRSLELTSGGRTRKINSRLRADKGHRGQWRAMVDAVRCGTPSPIPFSELISTTLATFRAMDSLQSGKPELLRLEE